MNCFCPNLDIRAFEGFHEEAGTRMGVNRVHSNAEFPVVSPQDTDVSPLSFAL